MLFFFTAVPIYKTNCKQSVARLIVEKCPILGKIEQLLL